MSINMTYKLQISSMNHLDLKPLDNIGKTEKQKCSQIYI